MYVAVNVSEIYYNGEEIKNNNEKLEFLNRKLEEPRKRSVMRYGNRETLMKMQVHDSFGRRSSLDPKDPGEKKSRRI